MLSLLVQLVSLVLIIIRHLDSPHKDFSAPPRTYSGSLVEKLTATLYLIFGYTSTHSSTFPFC